MDFHYLARRDLQFLCKKNGVPANLTNIAMAKALESLETVEGIEEIQEALIFRSPKLNSPEIRRTGLSTSSHRVTHGDNPKIQQKQDPSPLTVKTREVKEMASKEDETQETLGFQSLNVNSTELPRMRRRTSNRRAALEEEPEIQQLKPSSLHRSRRAASKDLEAIDMASKMEEGEKKEVSQILPKTPAARKAAKGVEAQSLRRTKKSEEVESHTESPKAVEAKGGKAIGVVTRRSTRLSSKKPLEESVTTQSNRRSSGRENSAVKMEALAKEDTRRSTRLSSRRPLEESVTIQSNRRSSGRENSAVRMEAFAKEDIAEREMQEEKKDLVEYGDSCVVIVEEHEEKVPEVESHEISSSIDVDDSNYKVENKCKAIHEDVQQSNRVTPKGLEATKMVYKEDDDKKLQKLLPDTVEEKSRETDKMIVLSEEDAEEQEKEEEKKEDEEKVKNGDSIVAIVGEVKESDQEVESHGFSSFNQGEGSNIEFENGDSTVKHVKGDEKNGQELEIQAFSSSIEWENPNVEQKNVSNVVLVKEEESHDISASLEDNSNAEVDEPFESTEEFSDQPPENENVEVYGDRSPENKAVEYCGDQSPENELVEDSSNPGSKFVEVSGDPLLTNEEAEKLSLLFTEMILKETEECGNSLMEPVLPVAMVLPQHADLFSVNVDAITNLGHETAIEAIGETPEESFNDAGELTANDSVELQSTSTELCTKLSAADSTIEFSEEVKESSGDLPSEDNLADSAVDIVETVDVPQKAETLQGSFFELKIHVSSSELCSTVDSVEEYLCDVHSPVSCGELCSDLTTVDSAIESEVFGLRGEFSAVDGLSKSDEQLSSEKSINAENSQDATFDPQNQVHSTAELFIEFSANAMNSPLELPCESETGIMAAATEIAEEKEEAKTKALEKPSEEVSIDATEIAEEKEEAKTKALEKDVLLKKGGNLELLSLTKLRAMYKQMLNGTKTDEEKKKSITEQDLKCLSCIKCDENCKQKLNDDMINLERKKSIIRQEDSKCLSHSKFDSNRKQMLNDDSEVKSERKRTPLKNLNYSSF